MEGAKVVGFLGLGNMGAPMVSNLLRAGFSGVVWDRTESKARPLLEKGAVWADSPQRVAEKSDVVITMLADAHAVREVLLGPEGAAASNRRWIAVLNVK